MTYKDREGWYLRGRYLGSTPSEAARALDPDARTDLIREYILMNWDLYSVASWISDGRRMPSADDVVSDALNYIEYHHGYETAGRPLAGICYGVVNRSYNIAPHSPSRPKASAKKPAARPTAKKSSGRR